MHNLKILFTAIGLAVLASFHCNAASLPNISHQPVKTSDRTKPINIRARVSSPTEKVSSVTLYFTQSRDVAPTSVEMSSTGVGIYYGTVPASFVHGKGTLHYYIEASSESGEWAETRWHTVALKDPGAAVVAPVQTVGSAGSSGVASTKSEKTWVKPALITGGVIAAVAGGIAIADSGSGGGNSSSGAGGGDSGDDSGSDTGGDTTPAIPDDVIDTGDSVVNEIRVSRSEVVSTPGLVLPQDVFLDFSGELSGRTVTGGTFVLDYNPIDGAAESFQVFYNGLLVFETGIQTIGGQASGSISGSTPLVLVRTVTSEADASGLNSYTWNLRATFDVE